jgi:ABC-type molybdate transport system ATPase subunit
LDKVLSLADRLILLDKGAVAANGRPEEVVSFAPQCGVRLEKGFTPEKIGEMTWLKD